MHFSFEFRKQPCPSQGRNSRGRLPATTAPSGGASGGASGGRRRPLPQSNVLPGVPVQFRDRTARSDCRSRWFLQLSRPAPRGGSAAHPQRPFPAHSRAVLIHTHIHTPDYNSQNAQSSRTAPPTDCAPCCVKGDSTVAFTAWCIPGMRVAIGRRPPRFSTCWGNRKR